MNLDSYLNLSFEQVFDAGGELVVRVPELEQYLKVPKHRNGKANVSLAEGDAAQSSASCCKSFGLPCKHGGLGLVAQSPVVTRAYVAAQHAYGRPLSGCLGRRAGARKDVEQNHGLVIGVFCRRILRCAAYLSGLSVYPQFFSEELRVYEAAVGL